MKSFDRLSARCRRDSALLVPMAAGADSGAGRLDRAVPRAFWRMLQIGERAGLIQDVHRAPLLELFIAGPLPARLEHVLRAFEIDRLQLYALVTLFSADPLPVEVAVVARDCVCEETELERLLDHFERQEIVVRESGGRSRGVRATLTELGRETAVYAIYRVINAAKECVGTRADR